MAERGDPKGALQILEDWLRRPPVRVSDADAVAFHLEAARQAAAASEPERAAPHLAMVQRLSNALSRVPVLRARLLRETARVYAQVGDFQHAAMLLSGVVDSLAPSEPEAAAEAASALGTALLELRNPTQAIAAFERELGLLDRAPPDKKRRVVALVNLSNAELEADHLPAARGASDRARQEAEGDASLSDAVSFAQARLLLHEVRLKEADALLEEIAQRSTLSDPALRGHALLLLATSRFDRGVYPEADTAALAAVEAYRVSLGEWHPVLGRAFHNLGTIRGKLHDLSGAAAVFARAEAIDRRSFGSNSVQFQTTEMEQAWLDVQSGDLAAAQRRATAALKVFRAASPPDRRLEGLARVLLGLIAEAQPRQVEAVEDFRAGQRLIALARGTDSPDLGFSLIRLGRLLTRMDRFDEAQPPLDRAVALYERLGDTGTVPMADALAARAELRARRGDRRGAIEDSGRSFAALRSRLDRSQDVSGDVGEFQRNGARELFAAHAKLLIEFADGDPGLVQEAFTAAQYSLISRAADALRQTTIRLAAGQGELARLLRDREDMTDGLRQTDALARKALERSGVAAAQEGARLRQLRENQTSQLRGLDNELAQRFAGYSEFLNPQPTQLASVQHFLASDEAVIMTLVTDDSVMVWTITGDATQVQPVPVSRAEIGNLVRRVRGGVDLEVALGRGGLPEFDRAAAQRLYQILIEPGRRVLADKRHLTFIPDGALQTIPLHLLLGGEPEDWLVRKFAVTVAPSAATFVTQRESALPSGATLAFFGVGNPRFTAFNAVRSRGLSGITSNLRDKLAGLPALPETAVELQRMAGLFPEGEATLILGENATKPTVLQSHPDRYRILAFSTHALMAGQLPGLSEPAIVLTPDGKSEWDGLLTASDIAALQTDADLVILSACNTAAPDGGPFEDGFSGLARAFLHAGARSLLVSNWSIASEATVELTTGFLSGVRESPNRRRADALQRSMLKMLDSAKASFAHPALWAPFVVVGD
jgi:CHAT domain-containing protein/tetratricopeptide (TPR) repeat protein